MRLSLIHSIDINKSYFNTSAFVLYPYSSDDRSEFSLLYIVKKLLVFIRIRFKIEYHRLNYFFNESIAFGNSVLNRVPIKRGKKAAHKLPKFL